MKKTKIRKIHDAPVPGKLLQIDVENAVTLAMLARKNKDINKVYRLKKSKPNCLYCEHIRTAVQILVLVVQLVILHKLYV